jgi:hypothetical protein
MNMTRTLASILPYIILALLILGFFTFVVSLQQLRRGRTGPYWRIRRAAGQRGGQLFLLSIALIGIATTLAFFSGLADLAYRRLTGTLNSDPNAPVGVVLPTITETRLSTLTSTPSTTPSNTPTVSPSPTRQTRTPIPSATNEPTATLTATLTPSVTTTPTATFESVLVLTPLPSAKQPRSGARVEIVTASVSISADQTPVDPGSQFLAGVERIYLFFEYSRMDDGISWSRILFRGGVPMQGQSYLWSLGSEGSSYFFFGSEEGYPAGEYEVGLFLGDQEISRFPYTIAT